MAGNSSNHCFTKVPQINLQFDNLFPFVSTNRDLSQIEMAFQINEFNSDNNLISEPIKMDGKHRSSSMVSDQIDRADIDLMARNRAGSMFVPNLCVHCKMLEEIENQNIESSSNNLSEDCQMPLNSYDNSDMGSPISSRSSSNTDTSIRSSIENDTTQFCLTKEFGQFLEVPKWKPRASSLDSGIFHNDLVLNQSRRASFEEVLNQDKPRATSVDVHMQCDNMKSAIEEASPQQTRKKSKARFSIVSISSRQTISRVIKKLKSSKFHLSPSKSKGKKVNYCSQWNYDSNSREHIWYPDNSVRQRCTVGECTQYNSTETHKCSACKTVSCTACKWKIKNSCRRTFIRKSQEEESAEENHQVLHHWVHKNHYKGTCKSCSKNMTSQNIFLNKQSVIALQCSWCKICYHNKKACFSIALLNESCYFGSIKESIVHPGLIEKSPIPLFISERDDENSDSEIDEYPFLSYSIKYSENTLSLSKSAKPIIALINPKSGGRQGLDLLNELQWTLNPRQVFDICTFSPEYILKLFKPMVNLRILVGGGDGTVNWILRSIESSFSIEDSPPIAVMPIGTGNDLARELNWGSSYNGNDPISKIIAEIEAGSIVDIDIWKISAYSVSLATLSTIEAATASLYTSKLPLESFNNYFSVGSDAATALEFHLDREKNPNRYNSRLKNKLCYVEIGSKDLWKREYKNLSDNISLVCDGVSYESRLAELRPHCILFLNITNYSAGTNPWGKYSPSSDFVAQSINDCILEVIGLSAASLATLHIGGQGDRICQCRTAEIEIQRDTPIQIDGEPMLIKPCTINISHKYQYPFIKRECRK